MSLAIGLRQKRMFCRQVRVPHPSGQMREPANQHLRLPIGRL
jgi:hypothetical protein